LGCIGPLAVGFQCVKIRLQPPTYGLALLLVVFRFARSDISVVLKHPTHEPEVIREPRRLLTVEWPKITLKIHFGHFAAIKDASCDSDEMVIHRLSSMIEMRLRLTVL
jgi:hypothetical protein